MTHPDDSALDHPAAGDPLLVRPYVRGEGAAPSAPTWPAPPEAPAAAVTVPLPTAGGPPARASRRRRWLALGALAAAVAVAAGIVGLGAALRGADPRTPQAFTDVSLPPWSRPSSDSPTTPATGGRAPTGAAAVPGNAPGATAEPAPPPASRSSRSSTPRTTGRSSPAPSGTPSATPSATPLLTSSRAITGPGGLCLEADGDRIRVAACRDIPAQQWTAASDGTLRVADGCAAAARYGRVRLGPCDRPRSADRWQPGPGGTLVNTTTRACLTDRAGGSRPGTAVALDTCGAPGQQWVLPAA